LKATALLLAPLLPTAAGAATPSKERARQKSFTEWRKSKKMGGAFEALSHSK